ncbi:protein ALP1-like [Nilaparvata lugens]|uniref:protein ALP1-like n=1 Tax=Nilaparvata lugens TaxID=108931 RepID=UPI00193E9E4E|nr:protein ALP1-like [Nilaparvata lugens]
MSTGTHQDKRNALMVMSGVALLIASLAKQKKTSMLRPIPKNFCGLSSSDFENLLQKIGPIISKQDTYFHSSISAQDRLAVTLRFLATGDSYTSLQYTFWISKQSIGYIVPEVCTALINELRGYIKLPKTPEAWKEVSKVFKTKWNLPHCIGALDGKHIILQAPINSGTEYSNYKSNFSIVLFALVDANANFIFADVGCQGRISDGGVFRGSTLHRMIEKNRLGLPMDEKLPGRSMSEPVPYFFAGDSAFTLSDNLMKPYHGDYPKGTPQRIFNYRLSRARQVVKDAFGILSAEFRVLRKPMILAPEK